MPYYSVNDETGVFAWCMMLLILRLNMKSYSDLHVMLALKCASSSQSVSGVVLQ